MSPYVELEVVGAEYDNVKHKTKTINDNGFNPIWGRSLDTCESFDLYIQNPDLALLRYETYHIRKLL